MQYTLKLTLAALFVAMCVVPAAFAQESAAPETREQLMATVQSRRNKLKLAWERLRKRMQKRFQVIVAGSQVFEDAGWVVDTDYTDAYGYNVTCSPNSWYRKL